MKRITQKKILLLEDVNENPRQLDRTLHQLLYKRNFHPKAIIFGQFYKDDMDNKDKEIYKYAISNFAKKSELPRILLPRIRAWVHEHTLYSFEKIRDRLQYKI
ncbi:hypothetical protein [Dickeya ananatis]